MQASTPPPVAIDSTVLSSSGKSLHEIGVTSTSPLYKFRVYAGDTNATFIPLDCIRRRGCSSSKKGGRLCHDVDKCMNREIAKKQAKKEKHMT
jgi:hypothetical protein